MIAGLKALPPKTVVVLHACCHNPTGVDPTPEQWPAIIAAVRDAELVPFLDIAYQGFGEEHRRTTAWPCACSPSPASRS